MPLSTSLPLPLSIFVSLNRLNRLNVTSVSSLWSFALWSSKLASPKTPSANETSFYSFPFRPLFASSSLSKTPRTFPWLNLPSLSSNFPRRSPSLDLRVSPTLCRSPIRALESLPYSRRRPPSCRPSRYHRCYRHRRSTNLSTVRYKSPNTRTSLRASRLLRPSSCS